MCMKMLMEVSVATFQYGQNFSGFGETQERPKMNV